MSFQQMLAYRRELEIASRYRILRKIGGGSFGDIYLGINIANGEVSSPVCTYSQLYLNALNEHEVIVELKMSGTAEFGMTKLSPQWAGYCEISMLRPSKRNLHFNYLDFSRYLSTLSRTEPWTPSPDVYIMFIIYIVLSQYVMVVLDTIKLKNKKNIRIEEVDTYMYRYWVNEQVGNHQQVQSLS